MAVSNRFKAKTLRLLIILTEDSNHVHVMYRRHQHKLLQFYQHLFSEISHLLLTSQREREVMQDERTHHGAVDKS